ncbi:MAG: hypothetical protein LUG18_12735 [Candidatus Azobacteroides sp.]|nr:hypothetical protein [Candidatus Azobacteroides sp.]
MKKILYFTHVPWNWIKQRPQFIAEELSSKYHVDIFQEKPYVSNLVSNSVSALKVVTLFRLPMNRITFIRKINSLLNAIQLKSKINHYDYIWLTSPTLYNSIKKVVPGDKKIIYDCMDDILAFPAIENDKSWKKEIEKSEKELLTRAAYVFCTSENLKEKIKRRYSLEKENIIVSNNAINLYDEEKMGPDIPPDIEKVLNRNDKNLTYIGTISQWFDFELILKTLKRHPKLEIYLFGPKEVDIPSHERLIYFGPVPHELVYKIMEKTGVLIMPFILNELILSVNPVKIYEYIYCQKITIARKYGETLKFNNYIYLYENDDEFLNLVEKYCKDELNLKQAVESYKSFGIENTWKNRVNQMFSVLENQNNNQL